MSKRRAQRFGRRKDPERGSVQWFAGTVNTTRNVGLVFSMQVDRNTAPTGRERSRAGR
jgi:hypothetical protein